MTDEELEKLATSLGMILSTIIKLCMLVAAVWVVAHSAIKYW